MKASQMREQTTEELQDKERDLAEQLFALRLQKVTGQLEKPSRVRQVRKDLAYFGQFGHPGIGYRVDDLIGQVRRILGTDKTWNVILVGAGKPLQQEMIAVGIPCDGMPGDAFWQGQRVSFAGRNLLQVRASHIRIREIGTIGRNHGGSDWIFVGIGSEPLLGWRSVPRRKRRSSSADEENEHCDTEDCQHDPPD